MARVGSIRGRVFDCASEGARLRKGALVKQGLFRDVRGGVCYRNSPYFCPCLCVFIPGSGGGGWGIEEERGHGQWDGVGGGWPSDAAGDGLCAGCLLN